MPQKSSSDHICLKSKEIQGKSNLPCTSHLPETNLKKRRRDGDIAEGDLLFETSEAEAFERGSKLRRTAMDRTVESKVQMFLQQSEWRPIPNEMFPTPVKDESDAENSVMPAMASSSVIMLSGCSRYHRPGVLQEIGNSEPSSSVAHYQFRNIFTRDQHSRSLPLPELSWTNSEDLWHSMVDKESVYVRNSGYMSRHPDLQPRMRSILLDWLMEVSEVYRLTRETFYLCVDYTDRYLQATKDIHKSRLQLVGITALFIAAKLEEIYPPKLCDFAYVTDNACTEEEILSQELLMLSTLKWSLAPVTPVSWLNIYMQTVFTSHYANASTEQPSFFLPLYSQATFIQIAQLIDLCSLDIESLDFSTAVLAASALYHFAGREVATEVSGFHFRDISPCVSWLSPFAITVREAGLQKLKQFSKVNESDYYNIQTHANSVDTLDHVYDNRSRAMAQLTCQSPTEIAGFMTPPKSGQKPAGATVMENDGVC